MITYITAFIFYTLAMVGIMLVGFVIYKKTFIVSKADNKGLIKVIDSYMIAPKKTLLIVKINNERFLIASDASATTFLAKLDSTDELDKAELYNSDETLKEVINKMNSSNPIINPHRDKTENEDKNKKYDDYEQKELQLVQKQYMDLYKNVGVDDINAAKKISAKKQVIKKLLKELEDTKTQIGSKY